MLDIAQVFAWSRMFTGYVRCESVVEAAKETFDPAKPCAICLAVGKARAATGNHAPALPTAGPEKIVLFCDRPAKFVSLELWDAWPAFQGSVASPPGCDVPLPPPRGTEPRLQA